MTDTQLSAEDIVRLNKEHVLFSWSAQGSVNPLPMVRGEGVFCYDADGKRYFDFSSQLMCTNLGHGHPRVVKAIQDAVGEVQFLYPGLAHPWKGKLAKKLTEICPGDMAKAFFTLGGAEANENAIKMARMFTGRHKILTRYRSYHGATHGAMALSGDPRRLAAEPAISGVVHFHAPYPYRCPFYSSSPEECTERSLAHLRQVVGMEGVDKIAAIFMEGINGSSGLHIYPPGYMEGVRAICDEYGILLVIDEVMSGFGRTGKMFGCENYDARPDMITMAKGLTSSYLPLGAVTVSRPIAEHFEKNPLVCGLTYSGHPVSCAAALAVIETMEDEDIVAKAAAMGKVQDELLAEMQAKHKSVGEVRNIGLFGVIEVVKDRETREPMAPWNARPDQMGKMSEVAAYLKAHGLMTFVRWNWVFCVPPLTISEAELREAYGIIDEALKLADAGYTGE